MNEFEVIFENQDTVKESWTGMLSSWVNWFLQDVKLDSPFKMLSIKGKPNQVKAFINALKEEKKYAIIAKELGTKDRKLFEQKQQLEKAVEEFEKETGIKWPVS
jgi:REP element-mobilizing transposase RayT